MYTVSQFHKGFHFENRFHYRTSLNNSRNQFDIHPESLTFIPLNDFIKDFTPIQVARCQSGFPVLQHQAAHTTRDCSHSEETPPWKSKISEIRLCHSLPRGRWANHLTSLGLITTCEVGILIPVLFHSKLRQPSKIASIFFKW